MEISGKIIQVLPERGGISQRTGTEWKLAQYIIETFEQFPKKCVFEVFGSDRIAQMNIQAGQSLTVSVDIDAHEFNGRWYNTVRAWKVVPYDPNAIAAPVGNPAVDPFAQPSVAPAQTTAPGASPAQPTDNAPFPSAQPAAAPSTPTPVFGGDSNDDLPF